MASSALNIIKEQLRQGVTGDVNFLKKFLFFFELRIPASTGIGGTTFFYPLVINPESYTLEEPFAVQATPTQGGGLYVEENGIIQRTIKLRGHTGFKPRPIPGKKQPLQLYALKPETKSFSRSLQPLVLDAISGHRHFQYLQDAVFRTYADLKRDPATSEGTQLIFHNAKDEEHWLVAPRSFVLERQVGKQTLYQYSIDLLVVDKAEKADQDFSEDQGLLDAMKNKLRTIKAGVDLVTGAINDITAIVDELERLVKDIGKIIDSCTAIIDAASAFVDGVVDLIESPYAVLASVQGAIDSALEFQQTLVDAGASVGAIPDTVDQMLKQINDGLDLIGSHPEAFEKPVHGEAADWSNKQNMQRNKEAIAAASLTAPPDSLRAFADLGSGPLPGDARRAAATLQVGGAISRYTGARDHVVQKGDTLVNLAARYLGDARKWQQLAELNGLKPPFIDDQASKDLSVSAESPLTGAVGIGRTILIPTFSKSPQNYPLLPVLGVQQDEDLEAQVLGTDLAFEPSSSAVANERQQWDVPIDVEGGSIDAKIVRGRKNLVQAMMQRVVTEQGSNPLYSKVGIQRIVGLGSGPVDMELCRFRVAETLLADPRTAAIQKLRLDVTPESPDTVVIDAEVQIRGFTQSATIRSALPTL